MDFSIKCAYAHGTSALRTHLINMTPRQTELTWPVFAALRKRWAGKVRRFLLLQCLGMSMLGHQRSLKHMLYEVSLAVSRTAIPAIWRCPRSRVHALVVCTVMLLMQACMQSLSWHVNEIVSVCKHLCRRRVRHGAFCPHLRCDMQVELQAVALVVLSFFRDAAAAARLADTVQPLCMPYCPGGHDSGNMHEQCSLPNCKDL